MVTYQLFIVFSTVSVQIFLSIFYEVVSFSVKFESTSYNLDTNPLSDYVTCKYFAHIVAWLFILLAVSLKQQVVLIKSGLSFFFFYEPFSITLLA